MKALSHFFCAGRQKLQKSQDTAFGEPKTITGHFVCQAKTSASVLLATNRFAG